MKECLASIKFDSSESFLDKELQAILDKGFIIIDEGIFLEAVYPSNYSREHVDAKFVKAYLDYSGYEVSNNRFIVGDYTGKDSYHQCFIFLDHFRKKWCSEFPNDASVVIINFQDDEIGKFSKFTFHKFRKDEVVCDIDNLESYNEPLYVEYINLNVQ